MQLITNEMCSNNRNVKKKTNLLQCSSRISLLCSKWERWLRKHCETLYLVVAAAVIAMTRSPQSPLLPLRHLAAPWGHWTLQS